MSPIVQEAEEKIRARDNVILGLRTAALKYKAQATSASRSSRPVSPKENGIAKRQKLATELANGPLPPGLVSPEEKAKKLAAEPLPPRPSCAPRT